MPPGQPYYKMHSQNNQRRIPPEPNKVAKVVQAGNYFSKPWQKQNKSRKSPGHRSPCLRTALKVPTLQPNIFPQLGLPKGVLTFS